jgi:hypothetical protein
MIRKVLVKYQTELQIKIFFSEDSDLTKKSGLAPKPIEKTKHNLKTLNDILKANLLFSSYKVEKYSFFKIYFFSHKGQKYCLQKDEI